MRGTKSFFGPVALIAVGLLLLANNLVPQFSLFRLFADQWPWILVLWGSFRIAEYTVRRGLGRATPENAGFGAVLLAVLLCLAGSTAHAWTHGGWRLRQWVFPVDSYRFEFRMGTEPGRVLRPSGGRPGGTPTDVRGTARGYPNSVARAGMGAPRCAPTQLFAKEVSRNERTLSSR
jgi:hypothetical protein